MSTIDYAAPDVSSPPATAPSSIPLPPRLFVPLPSSESRELCLPIGSMVKRGDALLTSAPGTLHRPAAPAAGKIVGLVEVARLGGERAIAVEIEVDPNASRDVAIEPSLPATPASPAAAPSDASTDLTNLIELLRNGGVQADRHTSPNLLGQLHEALRRPIDTVLCSLLDPASESELHMDVVRESGEAIVAGMNALAKATGANRVWCAADTRVAPVASTAIRKAGLATRFKLIEIANDYPQADPTLLLYALLGRRLKPGRLPTEASVVMLDGPAAAAIGRRVATGQPMLDVTIEIRESDRAACSVRNVAIGTPLRYVLEQLWLRPDRLTLRAGGALRDVRVSADAVFDGVAEATIDAGPITLPINPDPCIRCGWCVEACPVRIHPAGLLEAAQDSDLAAAVEWYGLSACIECGICSYVCPSRLPLLPAIRELRSTERRKELR